MFYPIDKIPEHLLNPETLGGKGYNLAIMKSLGVNVPPAVVIPTSAYTEYMQDPEGFNLCIKASVPDIVSYFTSLFGYMPLVSVRSGSRVSCPGMMDTVLNVGIHPSTFKEWSTRLPLDCLKDSFGRLIYMYSDVVLGISKEMLGSERKQLLNKFEELTRQTFPDPEEQLAKTIEAVFKSWNNKRAKEYRAINNIPAEWGTAVVIQAMVFGNFNDKSCTGVLFTRDPNTGSDEIVGEFLVNAQGEDVVAGVRTPEPIATMYEWNEALAHKLGLQVTKLENHYKDMQDVEFTVQDGELYILQTRNGKRTAQASIKIAVDLHDEGVITAEQALKRVSYKEYLQATQKTIDPSFKAPPSGVGIAASPGVVRGKAMFSSDSAHMCAEPYILVMEETTPNEVSAMHKSVGMLTAIGGLTSHSAVVARSMNKACVVGCPGLVVGTNSAKINGVVFSEGEWLTIDGATGNIWVGIEVPLVDSSKNVNITKLEGLLPKDYVPIVLDHREIREGEEVIYSAADLFGRSEEDINNVLLDVIFKYPLAKIDTSPIYEYPEVSFMDMIEAPEVTPSNYDYNVWVFNTSTESELGAISEALNYDIKNFIIDSVDQSQLCKILDLRVKAGIPTTIYSTNKIEGISGCKCIKTKAMALREYLGP